MKRAVTAILCVVLLFVLGAGIFVLYRYTNGFNEDFKTFYIERDGERILASKSTAAFEPGSEVRFDVGYVFDGTNSAARDYSVTILPNPEADFDFEAGGLSYAWRMAGRLDGYFSLDKQAAYFTLSAPQGGIGELLREIYHDTADLSEAFPGGVDPETPFFLLRVSSYNEAVTYDVVFSVFSPYKVTYETKGGTDDMVAGITYRSGGKRVTEADFRFGMTVYPDIALTSAAGAQYNVVGIEIYDGELKNWRKLYESDDGFWFKVQTETIRLRIELAPKSQFYKITYEISGGETYGLFLNDLPEQGLAGKEITFTAQATGIYYLASVTVTGSAIEDQSLSPASSMYAHDYSFTMPACDVVIKFELRSGV